MSILDYNYNRVIGFVKESRVPVSLRQIASNLSQDPWVTLGCVSRGIKSKRLIYSDGKVQMKRFKEF